MYRNFFSLSELPFSISPDPKYLFMSERHKEALSHLTYGLGEVGGFALLTGEVGTGKTTISRCLMEQLPINTQAAFILNPTLSSQELLATLCDQLKIRYRKTDASLKNLTDKISEKLLKNHKSDINTLLIIDEAQHLQPEVLEQLRLLTNLETNTKKLLQVILIGQPELQQLLQRRDLRQLAQRITARYHLMPLTKPELQQYIEHRLQVANCARLLFDKGALAKIHQVSQGIPRLINLLCHSALMLAYNQNDSVVNKKTVIAAAERALGSDINNKPNKHLTNTVLMTATALSLMAFVALASFWWGQSQRAIIPEQVNIPTLPKVVDMSDKPKSESHSLEKIVNNPDPVSDTSINKASSNNSKVASIEPNVKIAAEPTNIHVVDTIQSIPKLTHTSNTKVTNIPESKGINVKKPEKNIVKTDYRLSEIDGVSADLLARFQAAIDETEVPDAKEPQPNTSRKLSDKESSYQAMDKLSRANSNDSPLPNNTELIDIKPLTQMSQRLQKAIPAMNFEQHIYASSGDGWIKVNGRDRYEGDFISDNVKVEKILPQQVILSFRGEKFSLPALTNW
jgi:type II secretory pathway predicted ATPase ExeA